MAIADIAVCRACNLTRPIREDNWDRRLCTTCAVAIDAQVTDCRHDTAKSNATFCPKCGKSMVAAKSSKIWRRIIFWSIVAIIIYCFIDVFF